jgi:ribosome-associated protein
MKKNELKAQVATAVHACQEKKATDISILQLDAQASGFTDYFIICSASNPRQIHAIADEVDQQLSAQGLEPTHREGYNTAEWVLLDYVDFVVHIFSEAARKFYDLERLWKTATRVELSDLEKPTRKAAPAKAAPAKAAPAKTVAAKKTAARKSATKGTAAKKSAAKKAPRPRTSL